MKKPRTINLREKQGSCSFCCIQWQRGVRSLNFVRTVDTGEEWKPLKNNKYYVRIPNSLTVGQIIEVISGQQHKKRRRTTKVKFLGLNGSHKSGSKLQFEFLEKENMRSKEDRIEFLQDEIERHEKAIAAMKRKIEQLEQPEEIEELDRRVREIWFSGH